MTLDDLMTENCKIQNSINVHNIKEPRLQFECTKQAIDEYHDFEEIFEVGKYYLIVGLNGERFYAKLIAGGNDNAEPIFGFDNFIKSKRMMGSSDIEDDFTISYGELGDRYQMFKVEYDEHNFLQLRHKGGRIRHFTRKRRFPRKKQTRVSKKSRNTLNRKKRKL